MSVNSEELLKRLADEAERRNSMSTEINFTAYAIDPLAFTVATQLAQLEQELAVEKQLNAKLSDICAEAEVANLPEPSPPVTGEPELAWQSFNAVEDGYVRNLQKIAFLAGFRAATTHSSQDSQEEAQD